MQYQQTLTSYAIGVVVIVTPGLQLAILERALEEVRLAIVEIRPGEIKRVIVPT